MTTAQDGGKIVSLTHRPPLPPRNTPGTHFCYRLSRPQGHSAIGRISCLWKIPLTPAGIEPATFRIVAQHLNHCAKQKWVPGAFSGGKGSRCVRLTALRSSCAVVMKSGKINFLESSGPLQACNGTALPRWADLSVTLRRVYVTSFVVGKQ